MGFFVYFIYTCESIDKITTACYTLKVKIVNLKNPNQKNYGNCKTHN